MHGVVILKTCVLIQSDHGNLIFKNVSYCVVRVKCLKTRVKCLSIQVLNFN